MQTLKKQLLTLGAESAIYIVEYWGKTLALKWRPIKPYLHNEIDKLLRTSRTSRECKMLTFVRTLGVPTPAVHFVDISHHLIIMDFIEGQQLKQLVGVSSKKRIASLCHEFGKLLGIMHLSDVVHGDPTTSNVVVDTQSKMWLVDFGLAEKNATIEMKGVDIHLLRHTYETTHWDLQETMLESTMDGYIEVSGDAAEPVLARADEIRERGRYH
ncbi:MAG: Kae1-associated kinase Bud32 [Candidatus Thorarchaeota archaeon]|nr:Kae1-associated kinase Bud32 [Candidatus Thorarchaeota archaeon]